MWQRILFGLFLAVVAYFVLQTFSNESFLSYDSNVTTPYQHVLIREPVPRGDMVVAPGGPNPPNVQAEPTMPITRSIQPEPTDPYDVTVEDADAPENLRHPERSFGPGIVPNQTAIAEASGLAGAVAESSHAFQQFSPEFVSNGGAFFGNVAPTEHGLETNYSAF